MADLVTAAVRSGAAAHNAVFGISRAGTLDVATGGSLPIGNINDDLRREMIDTGALHADLTANPGSRITTFLTQPSAWSARVSALLRAGACPDPLYPKMLRRMLPNYKKGSYDALRIRVTNSHAWEIAIIDVLLEFDRAAARWVQDMAVRERIERNPLHAWIVTREI